MTARLPQGQPARVRAQLEPRHLAVLDSLHHFRLLTTAQVQRLHVVDGASSSRLRRTQLMMKRLQGLGLVVRLSRIIGGARAGSSGFVYGLSALGQAVLDVGGPAGGRRRRVWETKPYFQDHMLGVAELYVQLRERERLGQADLLSFQTEPRAWRHFTGSGGELVVVKPDAFVHIGLPAYERRAFIEVDLSTESLPTIERKCLRYIAYWQSAVEQQRHGVFPIVTWVVPDARRQENIERVIGRLAIGAARLFTVALADDAAALLMASPTPKTSESDHERAPP